MSNADTGLSSRVAHIESVLSANDGGDKIDMGEILTILWRGKWFISVFAGLFLAGSVLIALWLPNEYKATAILMSSSSSGSTSLSRLAGQLGGLASLAGVGVDGGSSDKGVAAMELIKTWGFLEDFAKEYQLEVAVFAAKGWDEATNRLILDANVYDEKLKKWTRAPSSGRSKSVEPSGWELYREMSDRISISQDKTTGLISLSVEYYSPYMAKEWVDLLVSSINRSLRDRERTDARRNIEYLQKQIEQTNLTEMRSVLYGLVEEQTKNLMLAEANDEYALKTFSSARVPEEKSKPGRAVLCVVGLVLGIFVGIFLWLGLKAGSRYRSAQRVP